MIPVLVFPLKVALSIKQFNHQTNDIMLEPRIFR